MRRWVTTLLVGVLGVACSGPGAETVVVEMLDNSFSPAVVTVDAGTPILFLGVGRNPHNAVAADGSWSTGDSFGSLEQHEGDEATVTITEPGTYIYFCTFHGNGQGQGMAGTVTVTPAVESS